MSLLPAGDGEGGTLVPAIYSTQESFVLSYLRVFVIPLPKNETMGQYRKARGKHLERTKDRKHERNGGRNVFATFPVTCHRLCLLGSIPSLSAFPAASSFPFSFPCTPIPKETILAFLAFGRGFGSLANRDQSLSHGDDGDAREIRVAKGCGSQERGDQPCPTEAENADSARIPASEPGTRNTEPNDSAAGSGWANELPQRARFSIGFRMPVYFFAER